MSCVVLNFIHDTLCLVDVLPRANFVTRPPRIARSVGRQAVEQRICVARRRQQQRQHL